MKFSIIANQTNAYQFAVTVDGVHSGVEKIPTLTQAMHLTLDELKSAVSNTSAAITGNLVAPISPEIELWGAGVTYLRSRDARKEESDRPELFFKSNAVRARGTNSPVGIRYDSDASVPEPEVAIYINKYREIIGYAICNDMTARTIEGENPLYLSQAKIYIGSTAIGPDITPAWLAPTPAEMKIKARILRGAAIAWEAETSLGALNRTLEDLITYLCRCQDFPHGVILSTGTGIVPPLDISLAAGDVVEIDVAGIGKLINPVEVIAERR
jgi:2-dehydro-3-deoxy-D-arabinonate dehydratase